MSKKKRKRSPERTREGDEVYKLVQLLDGDTLEPIYTGDGVYPEKEQSFEEFKEGFADGGTEVQIVGEVIATGTKYEVPEE